MNSTDPEFTRAWEYGASTPPGLAIRSLHNAINRYLAVTRPREAEGLSGVNIDHGVFPQDVERRFGITRSTSCRVLGLMERKGLIAREPVPRDARLKRIVLTAQARTIDGALRGNAIAMEKALPRGLGDDEIRGFMRTLDVIQTNLIRTGAIGDEHRYSSRALHDDAEEARNNKTGKEES